MKKKMEKIHLTEEKKLKGLVIIDKIIDVLKSCEDGVLTPHERRQLRTIK